MERANDPIFKSGHSLLMQKSLCVNIRYLDLEKHIKIVGEKQMLTVRVMTLGREKQLSQVRLVVTSESDIFLFFRFDWNEVQFSQVKQKQGFEFPFKQLPGYLMKVLNSAGQPSQKVFADLLILNDNKSQFTICKELEFKNVQLLSVELTSISVGAMEDQIIYRYEAVRQKADRAEQRFKQIEQIIRQKNPSLLAHISKNTLKL